MMTHEGTWRPPLTGKAKGLNGSGKETMRGAKKGGAYKPIGAAGTLHVRHTRGSVLSRLMQSFSVFLFMYFLFCVFFSIFCFFKIQTF
jgi:hypothetical protein